MWGFHILIFSAASLGQWSLMDVVVDLGMSQSAPWGGAPSDGSAVSRGLRDLRRDLQDVFGRFVHGWSGHFPDSGAPHGNEGGSLGI